MANRLNWLEQTWEIKRRMAERYAGMFPSAQLRAMRESVLREWKKRGWPPPGKRKADTPKSSQ